MLTSTKPRSPPRTPRTSHPPPISYSYRQPAPRPSSQATIIAPVSPSTTPPRGRRPSISNTMHWLSRSSTQTSSQPYAPSKTTRISEPKLVRSIELLSQSRSGVLGSGATVVRTPDEALRETSVRLTFDGKAQDARPCSPAEGNSRNSVASDTSKRQSSSSAERISPPSSPPLPPLPLPEVREIEFLEAESEAPRQPPRPTRAPPPAPATATTTPATPPSPARRPSLKSTHVLSSEEFPQVPPLPANIPSTPIPPPFRPILVSEVPTGAVDPSQIIVTLETCTTTYRTILDTLRARPSHLSDYLVSLFPQRASVASSVYSTSSDDMSTYRYHLTSQGFLPPASFSIHIFLDRSSAPYTHILNYLRSPLGTVNGPEMLPRSIQSLPSHQRLDALLELRDEAAYLNLDGLHKLCMDEIRLRHGPRLHNRGHSASTVGSTHSLHASIYSLHTLLERVETDMRSSQCDSASSDSKCNKDSPTEMGVVPSPPTPQSWNGPSRARSHGRYSPSRSPPAGWI
ncbi:hypothetical protein Hypma_010106 [Hypsizygus marmoreus]|uniref:BTB domain-containing protein n=1 Tax=Hypsizygus marmoreus TaxID=39966 RepID=A0A369JQ49_HYPMA|nr:hypothetical protein Hypma_010106 [Hypsizygus marmoreus]